MPRNEDEDEAPRNEDEDAVSTNANEDEVQRSENEDEAQRSANEEGVAANAELSQAEHVESGDVTPRAQGCSERVDAEIQAETFTCKVLVEYNSI